jgi:DNA replicative helicase MCM subunit Mcm2 (Cdc46/Mcm family)
MDEKDDIQDVEIMPTDIVFDCPNCNHNLVVDYRAAGLQVPCSQCGTIIQVPIPDGMLLEDLDCDPGELLQQLLQTRRMLVKAENAAQQMGDKIAEMMEKMAEYRKVLHSVKARMETLEEATSLAKVAHQDIEKLLEEAEALK